MALLSIQYLFFYGKNASDRSLLGRCRSVMRPRRAGLFGLADSGKRSRGGRRRPENGLEFGRRGREWRRRRFRLVGVEPEHPLQRLPVLELGRCGLRVGVERLGFEDARRRLQLRRVETLDRVPGLGILVALAATGRPRHDGLVGGRRDGAVVAGVRRSRPERKPGRNPGSVLSFLR